MSSDTEPGVELTPLRSGKVSTGFAQLLERYGASPELLRKVGDVTEDQPTSEPDTDGFTRAHVHRRSTGDLFARIAGADPNLLESLPRERVRYQTVGAVTALAAAARTVLISVAVTAYGVNAFVAALCGLVLGALSFELDRWFAVDAQSAPSRLRMRVWLCRSMPRIVASILLALMLSELVALVVFRQVIDAEIATNHLPIGQQVSLLHRLVAFRDVLEDQPTILVGRAAIAAVVIAIHAAPLLVATALRRRPGAYAIAASLQERYFPAVRELTLLRMKVVQRSADNSPESDLAGTLAAMSARIDALEAEISRAKQQTSAEIIDLETRRRRAG